MRTIKFRTLDDGDRAKYLGIPGSRTHMFNPSALLGTDLVAVCEGELDAIVCSAEIGIPAVGIPGVSCWKEHMPRMFAGIPRVVVFADDDLKENDRNPGRDLGERIARDLEQATVITPPPGMDLTEWYLRDGAETIREKAGL